MFEICSMVTLLGSRGFFITSFFKACWTVQNIDSVLISCPLFHFGIGSL